MNPKEIADALKISLILAFGRPASSISASNFARRALKLLIFFINREPTASTGMVPKEIIGIKALLSDNSAFIPILHYIIHHEKENAKLWLH